MFMILILSSNLKVRDVLCGDIEVDSTNSDILPQAEHHELVTSAPHGIVVYNKRHTNQS